MRPSSLPKKGERHRIPVDDVKSIQISRGALISSDAVMLAVEHEIEPKTRIRYSFRED